MTITLPKLAPVEVVVTATITFRTVLHRDDYYDDLDGPEIKLMTPDEMVATEIRIAKADPADSDLLNDLRQNGTITGFSIALAPAKDDRLPAAQEAISTVHP